MCASMMTYGVQVWLAYIEDDWNGYVVFLCLIFFSLACVSAANVIRSQIMYQENRREDDVCDHDGQIIGDGPDFRSYHASVSEKHGDCHATSHGVSVVCETLLRGLRCHQAT